MLQRCCHQDNCQKRDSNTSVHICALRTCTDEKRVSCMANNALILVVHGILVAFVRQEIKLATLCRVAALAAVRLSCLWPTRLVTRFVCWRLTMKWLPAAGANTAVHASWWCLSELTVQWVLDVDIDCVSALCYHCWCCCCCCLLLSAGAARPLHNQLFNTNLVICDTFQATRCCRPT